MTDDKKLLSMWPRPEKKRVVSLPPHSQKQPVGHLYHEEKQGVNEGMVLVRKNVGQSWGKGGLKTARLFPLQGPGFGTEH